MFLKILICSTLLISLSSGNNKIKTFIRPFLSCNRDSFSCRDGSECFSLQYLCNGDKNCYDGSDEEYCTCYDSPLCFGPPESTCSRNQFRCNSGECIPLHWECDGDFDCTDYSDEHTKCEKRECNQYEFTCDNGFCIDARLKCNSKNDCGDNSDESICQILSSGHKTSIANQTDCGNAFRCKDGTCIPYELVCNGGTSPDCPDGSDENAVCSLECNKCEYSSQITPSGCLCKCPPGNRLAGDGITCVDIAECTMDPPICSQLCKEEEGTYACKCFQEFDLRHDNITCKSQGDPMSIFYAVRSEIRLYTPSKRSIRIKHVETEDVTTLHMDLNSGFIYYSLQNNESLHQLVIANKSRKSIANVGTITLIALDWITENVYFISKKSNQGSENPYRLMICNFAERHCANFKNLTVDVTALTIDPINKYLFYATKETLNADDETKLVAHLYRTVIDGQYTSKIATFNTTITDMTLDYRHKHVYVVKDTTIDRLDYDGGRVLNMVEASMKIKGLNVFEDHLYFLTQDGLIMHKCRMFGEARRCSSFRLSAESTELFFIHQITRQTLGRNECLNYNCSHLCVPADTGAACLCENGKLVDETSDCRD